MTYTTLPLDLAVHREALTRLWAENMNDPAVAGVVNERVRWLYESNPEGPPTTVVVDDGGRDGIIGCASVVPRRVRLGGREVRAGILSDLAVARRHRVGGPAVMAQRALIEAAKAAGYAFVWGYPNKNSLPIVKRVGYKAVGESSSWVRPLRAAPFLRRFAPAAAADAGGLVLDAALGLVERGAALAVAHGREGSLGADFDGRFDELWRRARGAYDVTGARDAAFLRWRYGGFPSARHYAFGLTTRRSGALAGYVIYRLVDGARAHVTDLFCDEPGRQLDALLWAFVRAARAAGYDSIAIDLVAPEDVYARLRRGGFVRRPAARPFVVQPLSLEGEALAAVVDRGRWFIVDGDLDI